MKDKFNTKSYSKLKSSPIKNKESNNKPIHINQNQNQKERIKENSLENSIISIVQVKSQIGICFLNLNRRTFEFSDLHVEDFSEWLIENENIVSDYETHLKDKSYTNEDKTFQSYSSYELHYIVNDSHLLELLQSEKVKTRFLNVKPKSNFKFKYFDFVLILKEYFSLTNQHKPKHNKTDNNDDVSLYKNEISMNILVNFIIESTKLPSQKSIFYFFSNFFSTFLEKSKEASFDFRVYNKYIKNKYILYQNSLLYDIKVFNEVTHPSMIKGQGKSKEAYSLFSIFSKSIITPQGKVLLHKNFTYILRKRWEIEERQSFIHGLMLLHTESIIVNIRKLLGKVKDFKLLLTELNKFKISNLVWFDLFVSINSCIDIIKYIKDFLLENDRQDYFRLIKPRLSSINMVILYKISSFITSCVEVSSSFSTIKTGVNEELDKVKEDYDKLNTILQSNSEKFQVDNKESTYQFFTDMYFSFFPQIGYMLGVKKTKEYYDFINSLKFYFSDLEDEVKYRINGIVFSISSLNLNVNDENKNIDKNPIDNSSKQEINQIEDLNPIESSDLTEEIENFEETILLSRLCFEVNVEFQFHSEEAVYFKCKETNTLDKKYGDLAAKIVDIENLLFREISRQIIEYTEEIIRLNSLIALIDCMICYYSISIEYNLTRPQSFNDDYIKIYKAKSLTNQIIYEDYIEQDILLNHGLSLILGSNTSGKTSTVEVLLQTVFLNQIGCFVPCFKAELPVFSSIFSYFSSNDSNLTGLSGFTKEISCIHSINSRINSEVSDTSKSLVILDDPYRKTSEINKVSLVLGTILKYIKINVFSVVTSPKEGILNALLNRNTYDYFLSQTYKTKLFLMNINENDYVLKDISYIISSKKGVLYDFYRSLSMKIDEEVGCFCEEYGVFGDLEVYSKEVIRVLNDRSERTESCVKENLSKVVLNGEEMMRILYLINEIRGCISGKMSFEMMKKKINSFQ